MIESTTLKLAQGTTRTPEEHQQLEKNLTKLVEESSARVHRGLSILPPNPEWFEDQGEALILDDKLSHEDEVA